MISYHVGMVHASKKIAPIENRNKIEQIVDSIKKFIIEGELQAGTPLPSERELATQLGVSRFSLREGLQVAKSLGLITISRGKRPEVANPSAGAATEIMSTTIERTKTSLFHLVEARQCLEYQIARFAAQRAGSADIEMLEENLAELKKNRRNVSRCVELDLQFHDILVKATGNMVFEIMLAPLAQLLRESRKQTFKADGVDRALQGHEKILKAIKAHDAEGAAQAMSEHLHMAQTDLKKAKGMEHGADC